MTMRCRCAIYQSKLWGSTIQAIWESKGDVSLMKYLVGVWSCDDPGAVSVVIILNWKIWRCYNSAGTTELATTHGCWRGERQRETACSSWMTLKCCKLIAFFNLKPMESSEHNPHMDLRRSDHSIKSEITHIYGTVWKIINLNQLHRFWFIHN